MEDDFLELTCPGCGNDLGWDDLFLSHRVCGECHRHFPLSSRERLALIVEDGSFRETNEQVAAFSSVSIDAQPIISSSPAQRLTDSRERDLINDTVVTGIGRIGTEDAVVVVLDEHASGMTIGSLTTEKIVLAMELATSRRLPLVIFVTGGNAPATSGPLSLVQPNRIAAAHAQLHIAGVPTLAILCESASTELVGALAGQCDVVIAEPDARIWHERSTPITPGDGPAVAERMRDDGWVDDIVNRDQQHTYIANLLDLFGRRGVVRGLQRPQPAPAVQASSRDALQAVRNPARPSTTWYVEQMIASRVQLRGDRSAGDSANVIAGVGRVDGVSVIFAALDRADRETPEGVTVRKLIRMIGLASRLDLPLLLLVGSEDAAPGTVAGAMAIAKLSGVLTMAPVPIVVTITGEVKTALSRALITGDRILCQANAVFSLVGTKPGMGRLPGTGWNLVTATEAQRLGLIDQVVTEPAADAATDPAAAATLLRDIVAASFAELTNVGSRRRVADRQQRIRSLGQSTPAGRDALRDELNDLRELQRNFARSVEDWRERWDQLRSGQRGLNIQRPDLTDFANRFRARRAELLERASRGDRHHQ
jgi:acetyl-CoA carboxylase carboxyl transferase subunit beta